MSDRMLEGREATRRVAQPGFEGFLAGPEVDHPVLEELQPTIQVLPDARTTRPLDA